MSFENVILLFVKIQWPNETITTTSIIDFIRSVLVRRERDNIANGYYIIFVL